jgi:hypothetical protein
MDFPSKFPDFREFTPETGSQVTASATTQRSETRNWQLASRKPDFAAISRARRSPISGLGDIVSRACLTRLSPTVKILSQTRSGYETSGGVANWGFKVAPVTAEYLAQSIWRAHDVNHDRPVWQKMQTNGMNIDVSWYEPAKRYAELYREIAVIRSV